MTVSLGQVENDHSVMESGESGRGGNAQLTGDQVDAAPPAHSFGLGSNFLREALRANTAGGVQHLALNRKVFFFLGGGHMSDHNPSLGALVTV